MSLIPTFTARKPLWRGSTSSEDMNSNFEEIIYDLNSIFSETSLLTVELSSLESRLRNEVSALNARLYAVSGLITAYETSASGYKILHEDFYLTKNIVFPTSVADEDKCIVETQFGVTTLPVNNSFSKVYTTGISDGKIYTAPDLVCTVTPVDENGNILVVQNNPIEMFNGTDENSWERKVKFNRDYVKTDVTSVLDITLPSVSNPNVNRFFFKPYPEGTVDIQAITYDTTSSQNNYFSGFPSQGEDNSRSKLYTFSNIQPTKFKVYLRQKNNYTEDGYKTFIYGMKEIGIEQAEYKSSGKIGIKFSLPVYETGKYRYITSLSTNPGYDNDIYKLSLYISEPNFQANIPLWTSSNPAITSTNKLDIGLYITSDVWVLVEMTQQDGDTGSPVLNSVTMTYTTV